MNRQISRNYTERHELERAIERIDALRRDAREALKSIEDEDAFEAEFDRIGEMYSILPLAEEAEWLEYPERRNTWFKGFAASFGCCKNKRISPRQADVFTRYTEELHGTEHGYINRRRCRVGDTRIEIATHASGGHWVTITKRPANEIRRLISLAK